MKAKDKHSAPVPLISAETMREFARSDALWRARYGGGSGGLDPAVQDFINSAHLNYDVATARDLPAEPSILDAVANYIFTGNHQAIRRLAAAVERVHRLRGKEEQGSPIQFEDANPAALEEIEMMALSGTVPVSSGDIAASMKNPRSDRTIRRNKKKFGLPPGKPGRPKKIVTIDKKKKSPLPSMKASQKLIHEAWKKKCRPSANKENRTP